MRITNSAVSEAKLFQFTAHPTDATRLTAYAAYHHVKIKNDSDGMVTIGPTASLANGWSLLPGDEIVVEVNDSGKIFVVGEADKTNRISVLVV